MAQLLCRFGEKSSFIKLKITQQSFTEGDCFSLLAIIEDHLTTWLTLGWQNGLVYWVRLKWQ